MIISTDFPGGNGIIKQLGQNEYTLEPDQRNGTMLWFYWCFKLIEPTDQTYIFHLQKGCKTAKGFAFSFDQGLTWEWAKPEAITENTFIFHVLPNTKEVMLSLGMTYTMNNWLQFIKHFKKATIETLCTTRNGRQSPLLRIKSKENPETKIIVTARHHCCEMMARYVLEGMIATVFENRKESLLKNIEFVFIPFVDLDGTEEGDQGKGRAPHDHNRDYGDICLYPETPAIKAETNKRKDQQVLTLDIHCPHLKGTWNEQVYIVGASSPKHTAFHTSFLSIIEDLNDGILPFNQKNILPFGQEWNTGTGNSSNSAWNSQQDHVIMSASIEVPYGNAEGQEVNQVSARKLGDVIIRSSIHFFNTI